MDKLPCFKSYDIRGRVPAELDERMAYLLGRLYADTLPRPATVAVGQDARRSSPVLARALARGLNDGGVQVRDLGLCGTENIYFAAAQPGLAGGIMVTASHNPADYNGMKLVKAGAIPVTQAELGQLEAELRQALLRPDPPPVADRGATVAAPDRSDYLRKILGFVDPSRLKPLKIVMNAGNGCAGPTAEALCRKLPIQAIPLHFTPDPSFPNGIPNPLLPENQPATAEAVRQHGADLGIAWDGDFDRCFFFDETGRFIDGYYIVGLLAEALLARHPGEKILYDPRMVWNTVELVGAAGGVPVAARTGHVFMKERMRQENALYGGEMSAHHYFREFYYCDSGMIPWLLVCARLSEAGQPLSALVGERMARYPGSGEINSRAEDVPGVLQRLRERYGKTAIKEETLDGLSLEFAEGWRFNVRGSQTEPLLRLNVESRGDQALMERKRDEILSIIRNR